MGLVQHIELMGLYKITETNGDMFYKFLFTVPFHDCTITNDFNIGKVFKTSNWWSSFFDKS